MRTKLRNLEEQLAGLLLAAVALLTCAQLILAQAVPELASPIPPLVLALFFVATLLGIPAATRREAHVSLGLLSRWASERGRRALRVVSLVAMLAFFAGLLVSGLKYCHGLFLGHNRGWLRWCPDWVVAASVPLAAALACLRAVQAWREKRGRAEEQPGPPPAEGEGG